MVGVSNCEVPKRNVLWNQQARLASLTLLSAVLSMVVTAEMASAQYCTRDQCDECNLCQCSQRCCHELPDLWLINTRCAPRCKNLDNGFDCLIYKRYDRKCCRWIQASAADFLAQESSMPTLFYSHGNSLNHKNAMKSCWKVYCKMRCCPGSKRLVFWSWPAERVYKTQGLRVREMIEKNLRIKYVYAELQGYYMAKLVNQMSLSQRVMMSGHSYGGITTAAALHYLGGGCLRGLTLDGGAAVERPNLRAAVISGAFDNDMLIPGHRYGQAFVAGEKIFVTRNINDSTLKKWPKTSWTGRRAIGVTGVNANCLGVHRNKLCQITMTVDVGKSHYIKPHLKSVRFVSALCCLSFPECQNCSIAANAATGDETAGAASDDQPATGDTVAPEVFAEVTPELLPEPSSDEQSLSGEPMAAEAEFVAASDLSPNEWKSEQIEATAGAANIRLWETEGLMEIDLTKVFGANPYPNEYANLIAEPQRTQDQHAELRPTLPAEKSDTFVAASPLQVAVLKANRPQRFHPQPERSRPQLGQPDLNQPPLSQSRRRGPRDFQSRQDPPEHYQPKQYQPRREILSEPIQPSRSTTEPQASQRSGRFQLWYRCGLCLALVLTGKIYIFFGKRVPTS